MAAKQTECQRLQAEGADQRQQTAAVVMEREALQKEQGRLQEQLADTKKQASPFPTAVANITSVSNDFDDMGFMP